MSAQPAVASHEHHITNVDLIWRDAVHYQRVSRPQRWKHTPASCGETERTERAQNFGCQFALQRGGRIRLRAWVLLPHEFLVEPKQPLCVEVTLPHESAEVTKTCSKRKPGFW